MVGSKQGFEGFTHQSTTLVGKDNNGYFVGGDRSSMVLVQY
jgi:hypothetical protein